jgi:hypothetical protein
MNFEYKDKEDKKVAIFYNTNPEFINSLKPDGLIIEGWPGFNDLGAHIKILEKAIGNKKNISKLCSIKSESESVTITLLKCINPDNNIKGIVLVPTEHYKCYEQFATPFYGKPYKNFYYNVMYEAINLLSLVNSKNIAIANITGANPRSADIDHCVSSAIYNYIKSHSSIKSIFSTGQGPKIYDLTSLEFQHAVSNHRDINRELTDIDDIETISTIDWTKQF